MMQVVAGMMLSLSSVMGSISEILTEQKPLCRVSTDEAVILTTAGVTSVEYAVSMSSTTGTITAPTF
jgi:hypothetical protein